MKKEISISVINKIKYYQAKIFDEEDEDYPDLRKICIYIRTIDRTLDKAGIVDKVLRDELCDTIGWYRDDNTKRLEERGWKIIYK